MALILTLSGQSLRDADGDSEAHERHLAHEGEAVESLISQLYGFARMATTPFTAHLLLFHPYTRVWLVLSLLGGTSNVAALAAPPPPYGGPPQTNGGRTTSRMRQMKNAGRHANHLSSATVIHGGLCCVLCSKTGGEELDVAVASFSGSFRPVQNATTNIARHVSVASNILRTTPLFEIQTYSDSSTTQLQRLPAQLSLKKSPAHGPAQVCDSARGGLGFDDLRGCVQN